MKPLITDPNIEEFTGKAKKLTGVRKIILYGSRARGDFQEWSDYDILVIVSEKNKDIERRIEEIAWDINYRKLVSIVPIICTESKFLEDEYEPLFMNVRRDGIVL